MKSSHTNSTGPMFWIALCTFLLLVIFINPLREMSVEDDWSYALTVRHLLDTGTYVLHDWAAASIPFQAYWGTLFAKLLGFSFISLRISTLFLAVVGLIAFFFLAREHDLNSDQAGLLSLGLLGCPLVLLFSFSFMTDVPFLSCSLAAIYLYTRAVRTSSGFLTFLASVASSAAVLIRQFGLAIPVGFLIVWLLQKNRRQTVLLLLIGLTLPLLATVIQIASGISSPNWTAELRIHQQWEYLSTEGFLLPFHIFWRITVTLQYLALFTLPFLLTALLTSLQNRNKGAHPSYLLLLILVGALMIGGIIYGRLIEGVSWLMPYLPWYLTTLSRGTLKPLILTIGTTLGGILLAWIFVRRYTADPGWEKIPAHQRMLDLTTLSFLLLQMAYVQFYDRYILVFLPFGLITAGRWLATWLARYRMAILAACLFVLAASALWTRGWISHEEAMWKGSEFLRGQGIKTTQIFGSWTWNSYYTFEDYLIEIGRRRQPSLDDFFYRWLPEKRKAARYLVTDQAVPKSRGKVVSTIPYKNSFFRKKTVFIIERIK